MTVSYRMLEQRLAPCGQLHLLRYWNELDPPQQAELANQIRTIDFQTLQQEFRRSDTQTDWAALARQATSPPAIRLADLKPRWDAQEACTAGEAALRDNRVAIVLVAGGQGTRLGFDHPKGMYPLGPISNRTLFQIHADRIVAMRKHYQAALPLFLMTSPATHDETVDYFQRHDFLGLGVDTVTFFCQGTMPALDAQNGQVLLADRHLVSLSPDGHGGTLAALARHGCLDRMRAEGFEHVYYFQVDNPLVHIADPTFIGFHLWAASELTTQVVAKQDPLERVGNVVAIEGRLYIIEYSDLPDGVANQRNEDGSLTFWAGNIAVHMFERSFLERMAGDAASLPFHHALKVVPYMDSEGKHIEPDQPNAIKLETFIFDLLPRACNALVVEVDEALAFAPLKNGSGAAKDSPETCRAAMMALCRRQLRQVGAQIGDEVPVEINPRFAVNVEQLAQRVAPGTEFRQATYLA